MPEESGSSDDALAQERRLEEHEREAQEHEAAERSPEATSTDERGGKPAPPGNVGPTTGAP